MLVVLAAFDGLVFVELPLPRGLHLLNSSESSSGTNTLRFAFAAISKFETSERFEHTRVHITGVCKIKIKVVVSRRV